MTSRLFAALTPTQEVRRTLSLLTARYWGTNRGRIIRPSHLHITMAFIGNWPDEDLDLLIDDLSVVPITPFTATLDNFVFWPKADVVCMQCTNVPPQMQQLHDDISEVMSNLGRLRSTRQYRPHVTLMRRPEPKPREPMPSGVTVAWKAEGFALMRSTLGEQGVQYRQLKSWKAD